MAPDDRADRADAAAGAPPQAASALRLRLYVAGATPNSLRAEQNLAAVLGLLRDRVPASALEIVDVFFQAKRAITDGVVVTPTLIALNEGRRIVLMGDLADQAHLERSLTSLIQPERQA